MIPMSDEHWAALRGPFETAAERLERVRHDGIIYAVLLSPSRRAAIKRLQAGLTELSPAGLETWLAELAKQERALAHPSLQQRLETFNRADEQARSMVRALGKVEQEHSDLLHFFDADTGTSRWWPRLPLPPAAVREANTIVRQCTRAITRLPDEGTLRNWVTAIEEAQEIRGCAEGHRHLRFSPSPNADGRVMHEGDHQLLVEWDLRRHPLSLHRPPPPEVTKPGGSFACVGRFGESWSRESGTTRHCTFASALPQPLQEAVAAYLASASAAKALL